MANAHHTMLAQRLQAVKQALPDGVTLVAVSKTRTAEEIQALYDLGHRDMGENYPQELREKQPQLPADIRWHFIGHLQTNKVKYIAPFVHLVHAVDSERLLDELEKRAAQHDRRIGVLLQLRIAKEETKHGMEPHALEALVHQWDTKRWPHLDLRGLMAMASLTEDMAQVRDEFGLAQRTFERLRALPTVDKGLFRELSMGMSGDVDQALAHGSTMVRIGTALFGSR